MRDDIDIRLLDALPAMLEFQYDSDLAFAVAAALVRVGYALGLEDGRSGILTVHDGVASPR